MKIAAAYIRVSDERQDEYSPDSQLKLIRDFAKKNDYIIPDEYIYYDDGISAKSTKKRDRFNDMIATAKSADKPFEAIIVWKYSRFARNQEQSIVYKSLLRKNNVDVISVSEPISDDPFGTLIERIIEWMDEYYLIRLSGEVKRGMLEKATRGEPMCHPAFGYDLIDNLYVPNDKAPYVHRIFTDFASGTSMAKIARQLNAEGILTVRGNTFDNRHIEYILNNPVYNGKIRWSTDGRAASRRDYEAESIIIVDGKHEKIVDDDLWEATQQQLRDTKKRYRRYQHHTDREHVEWMLRGLLRCSACNATLTLGSVKEMSAQCHKYTKGLCNTSHHISIKKANKAVVEGIELALATMNFNLIPHSDTAKQAPDYDKQLAAEQRKLDRCKEAFIAGIDTLNEYQSNKNKIMQSIASIEAEKAAYDTVPTFDPEQYAAKVRNVLTLIQSPTLSETEKNELLRTIIAHIIFNRSSSSMEIFFYA